MPIHRPAEDRLLRHVLAGDPPAWEAFVRKVADVVWTSCTILCRDDSQARAAFADIFAALKADGFARLRRFNGSGTLQTFVALIARDLLAERLMRLFTDGQPDHAWAAFEHFFKADITRILWRRMPEHARGEAYQDICLALIADDYRRIRAYGGSGSFTGFILQIVDRLAIDHLRRTGARRQIQAPVAALDEIDDLPSEDSSPEARLIEDEDARALAVAAQALRDAAAALSDTERLYLDIALGGGAPLAAREVAQLMGRPVAEVYKLKQRVMTRLRGALEKNPAVKLWRASV